MLGGNVEDLYVFGLNKDRGHMNDEWGGVWWWGGGKYMVCTDTRYMSLRRRSFPVIPITRHPQLGTQQKLYQLGLTT